MTNVSDVIEAAQLLQILVTSLRLHSYDDC